MPAQNTADRLRQAMTPRRRRQGLVLAALFLFYSVLGFLALPGVVVSQAKRYVADTLHLDLSIGHLALNPWMLSVRVDGLSVREPGATGEILVSADSVYVNAQLWSSLWLRGASLAEVSLTRPYVNARIRRDGRINLMQLVPPEDPEDNGEANWRIGHLAITGGRIAFHDDTRPTPFATAFEPLNLALDGLASRPDRDGLYTLHAETGEGEALDWRGTLAMQPVRSEGELRISGLKATTPWRYLQDQLPLVVEDGGIGISGHYRLTLDNGATASLSEGRVTLQGLRLHLRGEQPLGLGLDSLDLNGVHLDWPQQTAGFAALELKGLALTGADTAALAGFGHLALHDGDYAPRGQQARLARVELADLALADGNEAHLLRLPRLALEGIEVGAAERRARVGRILLERGEINVRRDKNGHLNWQDRLDTLARRLQAGLVMPPTVQAAAAPRPSATPAPQKPAPAWQASLGELDLADFRVALADQVPALPVATSLEHVSIKLLPRQKDGEPHALQGRLDIGTGGSLGLEGRFAEQPLAASASLDLKDLNLPPFAPYFMDFARFALDSGSLDINGKVSFAQSPALQAGFQGSIAVNRFAANDLDQDERFLAWQRLAASGIDWRLAPGRLAIRQVDAERPFMRLIIGADKTLNLSHVIVTPPESAPNAPAAGPVLTSAPRPAAPAVAARPAAPPYPVRVDRIRLRDGAMLFADLTLKPQFATGIQALNGDVTGISTDPAARATVHLQGRVDQYGKADIAGTLSPLASDRYTDLKVRFTDLELTTLTPYSAKFAGYRIDKGKLSLDLGYLITDRRLEATNKVVFNQLTLGEKVDSPDAMNLPLKLAVAILKDKDGVIDVDLPVTGSLDDPKFRVGPLVWKAFVNLLTKAATAPFKLIAGLVGGDDDMDTVAFVAGAADLDTAGGDKLDKLAKALAQRPALAVEIRGAFDPAADALALRSRHFEAAYQKRLAEGGKPRKVLEAMFTEKVGAEALARQRALSLKPAGDGDDALRVAEEAYLAALRNELVARETILDGDLRQLALERARVLRARLVEANQVDAARVFVLDPVTATATGDKVPLKVALSAN